MMIQITETIRNQALGNDYLYVTMETEKHSATITVCRGESGYIGVCVHNAANRVWRKFGKQFATAADAIANYKTPAIKAMIETACEMA
jgi:hypothetical protein